MRKKIIIKIEVIEEFGDLAGSFGQFEEKEIEQLVKIATKENMRCLAYIDIPSDTYFNIPQCVVIKKELTVLYKYKELNQNLLDAIKNSVDEAIEKQAYIKFGTVVDEG